MAKNKWIKVKTGRDFSRWRHSSKDEMILVSYEPIFQNWNFKVIRNGVIIRSMMTRTRTQATKLANNYIKTN